MALCMLWSDHLVMVPKCDNNRNNHSYHTNWAIYKLIRLCLCANSPRMQTGFYTIWLMKRTFNYPTYIIKRKRLGNHESSFYRYEPMIRYHETTLHLLPGSVARLSHLIVTSDATILMKSSLCRLVTPTTK